MLYILNNGLTYAIEFLFIFLWLPNSYSIADLCIPAPISWYRRRRVPIPYIVLLPLHTWAHGSCWVFKDDQNAVFFLSELVIKQYFRLHCFWNALVYSHYGRKFPYFSGIPAIKAENSRYMQLVRLIVVRVDSRGSSTRIPILWGFGVSEMTR